MEITVYNPQKSRLETIDAAYTDENTSWFDNVTNDRDIYTITDWEGCLLIREHGYTYPVLIYDISRAGIDNDPIRARALRDRYE